MHAHTQTQRTADRGVMGGGLIYCDYLYMFWYFDVSDDIFAMFVKRIKVQVLQLQVGTDSDAIFHLWTVVLRALILNGSWLHYVRHPFRAVIGARSYTSLQYLSDLLQP